ncbi:MAG: hypothetical protein ACXWID_12760 [Pyrinomonadaceae bacterium]
MKRCPQCNRTYTDDALSFCLDDGSPLVSASAPSSFDPSATIQYPQSRETTPQPTIAYGPGQPPPSTPPPPQWSPMPPITPQKRSVWPWILGIGAVLAFMGIGVVVLIIVLASMGGNNNNNANTNANANANRANRNSNAANTNANTRSTLASHADDFSSETWYTGSSQYGRTWYEDDEYHIKASTNGYIVMYAPDKPEFYDDNATVRATVRSVEGESPDSGYGLLVHGVRENNQFRDYGFLIYSGDSPKYAIVQHKNSTETKLVSWTATSTIRTGTTPNQLEVRIRDRRLDFYINGQFVTSITDSEDFLRGRVGFYSSDTNEVAFDDLEISK